MLLNYVCKKWGVSFKTREQGKKPQTPDHFPHSPSGCRSPAWGGGWGCAMYGEMQAKGSVGSQGAPSITHGLSLCCRTCSHAWGRVHPRCPRNPSCVAQKSHAVSVTLHSPATWSSLAMPAPAEDPVRNWPPPLRSVAGHETLAAPASSWLWAGGFLSSPLLSPLPPTSQPKSLQNTITSACRVMVIQNKTQKLFLLFAITKVISLRVSLFPSDSSTVNFTSHI